MAPKKGKSYDEDSDDEYGEDANWLQAQEQEHQKNMLSRKLRILDINKRKHADNISKIAMNQDSQVQHLKKENNELTTAVDVVECRQNMLRDEDNTFTLTDLTGDIDDLNATAKEEEAKIALMEKELKELEDRLAVQRGLAFPSDVIRAKTLIKKTRTMEYRQDHAVVRFNNKLSANYKFRESIESIRKVKHKFDVLYKRLNDELKHTRKEMAASTEEAGWRYQQRDEARAKITALEERRDKDMTDYNAEMKEMQRIIAYDNTLKEFMTAKANDRQDYKDEEDAKKRRNMKPDRDEEAERDEKQLMGIVNAMSPSDIEAILNIFVDREEECFALFNYVNDLTDEVDRLHEVLQRMQNNVQCMEKEEVHQDSSRLLRQSLLKERYERAMREAKEAYKQNEDMSITLTDISTVVNKLFWDLDCSRDEIDNMLACDDGVTERNIIMYLGIIEKQTIELLHAKQYTQLKKLGPEEFDKGKEIHDRETVKKPFTHFAIKHTSTVVPPVVANQDTERFTRPLSVTEMRVMVMKQRISTPSRSTTPTSTSTLSSRSQGSSDQATDQDNVSIATRSTATSQKAPTERTSSKKESSGKKHRSKRSHKRSNSQSSTSSRHSGSKPSSQADESTAAPANSTTEESATDAANKPPKVTIEEPAEEPSKE